MVLWCRVCDSLMGIHEPYCDRRADRNGLCPKCAENENLLVIHDSFEDAATVPFHGPQSAPDNVSTIRYGA